MSSRARRGVGVGIAHETAVDGIGQAPFETPQRFSTAFTGGAFALVVGPAAGVVAERGDGHDVQAMVELAIAGAGEPVADDIAGGGLDGGGAAVGGKRRGGAEPIDRADHSEDLAGQQSADAVHLGQGGTAGGDGGLICAVVAVMRSSSRPISLIKSLASAQRVRSIGVRGSTVPSNSAAVLALRR